LRDYVQSNGELGSYQRNFQVYDRALEPCRRCGEPIARLVQGARATFWCRGCQR
jgi:formamidopyrimidine-DNA glycosylase